MRIALTHAYCWPEVRRGAERILNELGLALAQRGNDVAVFSASRIGGRSTDGGVMNVRLQQRREGGYAHEADFGRRLLPYLVARRFDAVHSMGRREAVAAIRAKRIHPRCRTVFTDLGLPTRAWWSLQGKEEKFHERVVRDVDVYGAMSRYALERLTDEYGRQGVLTPGGVNLEKFVPAAARAAQPTLLFSGAFLEPRKGLAVLLEALPLIAREEPRVRLWISGPGDPAPLLEAAPPAARPRAESIGLGDADGQHERYGQAWATVLPSKFDSFGQALLESLACGTPIVASTHAAVPELVTAVTGALCEPDDPESLAAACVRALDLARHPETSEACRASARPYDWLTGLAPRYEQYYAGDGSTGSVMT
jgi:glycosyltransferase involved in cell wall biosynthesis